jgi:hypothetical protein
MHQARALRVTSTPCQILSVPHPVYGCVEPHPCRVNDFSIMVVSMTLSCYSGAYFTSNLLQCTNFSVFSPHNPSLSWLCAFDVQCAPSNLHLNPSNSRASNALEKDGDVNKVEALVANRLWKRNLQPSKPSRL